MTAAPPSQGDSIDVSVITPTRLLPDRLSMLVELNQSLSRNRCPVEHVIVVDGNPEAAIPAELAGRATIINSPRPIGQAAARNLGLVVAQGDWITSADDDDWLHPHSIDRRLEAIHGEPGALWQLGRGPYFAPFTSRRSKKYK